LLRAGNTQDIRSDDVVVLASRAPGRDDGEEDEEEERPDPNLNGFSAALSCYP
jgi:hypothetical protein